MSEEIVSLYKVSKTQLYPRARISDGRIVLLHRFIIEKYLNRKLSSSEHVHHINGNRLDNRIENLELWITCQPAGQRPFDLIKYAKEIIKNYELINNEEDLHYW